MSDPTAPPDDPAAIWRNAWAALARATHDRRHGFRHPVVATHGEAHGVDARTVVLRETDATDARLVFYSDRRSGKFADLALDPRLAWCFWDPRHRIQLRARTRASVHVGDEVAREAWKAQGDAARTLYASPDAPGTPLAESASDAGPADGFPNFAVVRCALEALDWLWLGRDEHRRLRFAPPDAGAGPWEGAAVAP